MRAATKSMNAQLEDSKMCDEFQISSCGRYEVCYRPMCSFSYAENVLPIAIYKQITVYGSLINKEPVKNSSLCFIADRRSRQRTLFSALS